MIGGEMSSEIPSGKVVTAAACRPSASTHKYCSLQRCSHDVRKAGGKQEAQLGIREEKEKDRAREKTEITVQEEALGSQMDWNGKWEF